MNCVSCYVEPQKLNGLPVTILDVFDDYALSTAVREEMYKCYPSAKLAHLKSGGNFPYLSRSDEVNLHLQVSVLNKILVLFIFFLSLLYVSLYVDYIFLFFIFKMLKFLLSSCHHNLQFLLYT
jgi:hypothetical protein